MGLPCFQAGKPKQARARSGDEHLTPAAVVKSLPGSGRGTGPRQGPAGNIEAVFTGISLVFYFWGEINLAQKQRHLRV